MINKELLVSPYGFFDETDKKRYRFSLFLVDVQCFFIKLTNRKFPGLFRFVRSIVYTKH